MNPFERHGITHLSPSQLNMFRSNRALWFVEKMKGTRGGSSLPMTVGNAVEDGVTFGLVNTMATIEEAVEAGMRRFRKDTMFAGYEHDKLVKQSKRIDPMVRRALTFMRAEYGMPTAVQKTVNCMLEGIPVPITGRIDFEYDYSNVPGLNVDTKTTARMPEEISFDHMIQGSIYWAANDHRAQHFLYVTETSGKRLPLTERECERGVMIAGKVAHAMQRFLGISNDPGELAAHLTPDYADYKWSGPTRAVAQETFGY